MVARRTQRNTIHGIQGLAMSEKKIKQLRKRIKPLQVEWLQSLLPEDQAKDITVDNVDGLLPDQTHLFGGGTMYLSYMSDKWIMKMLKRYPDITNYKQLQTIYERNYAWMNTL